MYGDLGGYSAPAMWYNKPSVPQAQNGFNPWGMNPQNMSQGYQRPPQSFNPWGMNPQNMSQGPIKPMSYSGVTLPEDSGAIARPNNISPMINLPFIPVKPNPERTLPYNPERTLFGGMGGIK